MAEMKKGDTVRVVQPVIQGEIVAARVDDDANFLFVVRWTDEAGEHERPFKQSELEPVPAAS